MYVYICVCIGPLLSATVSPKCVCMSIMYKSAHISLYVPVLLLYVCICAGNYKNLYVYVYVCMSMYPSVPAGMIYMCMYLYVLVCICLYMYVIACMCLYAYLGGGSRFHKKSGPPRRFRG